MSGLVLVNVTWAFGAGLSFTGWAPGVIVAALLAILGRVYGATGRSPQLADMAKYGALWLGYLSFVPAFTYLATSLSLPLWDAELARADEFLGFHWPTWFDIARSNPVVERVLELAYLSLHVQVFFSIFYFAHVGRADRNAELWWHAFMTVIIVALLSALFAALGPWIHYGFPPHMVEDFYLDHVLALREGSVAQFALPEMKGIITFPSYHTVGAVVLTYVYRRLGKMFYLIAALNFVMLLSIPVIGFHYLVDVIAGAAIAALSILGLRMLQARRHA